MAKISVIVPVYNVEDYLEECLDSIINQSFNDLEIICVNDGSTDNSLDILNKYARKDKRISIISQDNRGLGAARNTGLNNAHGEYIYFIDSDDYLETNALKELYFIACDKNVDLIIFKLLNFHDENRETFLEDYHEMPKLEYVYNKTFECKDIMDNILDLDVTVYTKFFKADLISKMRFNENLIFEDNLYTTEAILKSTSIYFYNKYLYYRRVRKDSIMTSCSINHIDTLEVANNVIDKINEFGYYNQVKEKFFIKKINIAFYRFNRMADENKDYFFNKLKEDFLEKRELYENSLNFDLIDSKSKFIYYSAIESNTSVEFELKNKLFDNNLKIDNLNKKNNSLIEKNSQLEKKLNSQVIQNKKLNQDLNELFSSNSWKLTKPLRKIRNFK